jgi:hypothetical protein
MPVIEKDDYDEYWCLRLDVVCKSKADALLVENKLKKVLEKFQGVKN